MAQIFYLAHLKNFNLKYVYAIVTIAILVIFGRTVRYDYALDDGVVILENQHVQQGVTGITDLFKEQLTPRINQGLYRPLLTSSYAIETTLFGKDKPGISHGINVAIYILLCMFLIYFWRQLFPSHSSLTICIGMLIFAIHPLHVESVANIKGRDDMMSFLFMILTLIYALKYIDKKKVSNLLACGVFFLIALFSKESSVLVVPLILLLIYVRKEYSVKMLLFSIPFGISGLVWLIARTAVLLQYENIQTTGTIVQNANFHGEHGDYYMLVFHKMWIYTQHIFAPFDLSWTYEYGAFGADIDMYKGQGLIGILLCLGFFSYLIHALIKKKRSVVFCLGFIAITFLIYSNLFFPIRSTMADRFMFAPLFGIAMGMALLINKFILNRDSNALILIPTAILIYFGVLSFQRTGVWYDDDTIIRNDIKVNGSFKGIKAYLRDYKDAEERKPVIKELYQVVKDNRSVLLDVPMLVHTSEEFALMGIICQEAGDDQLANLYFEKSLTINYQELPSIFNLATNYFKQGKYDLALTQYKTLITEDAPNFSNHYNAGLCCFFTEKNEEALQYFKHVLDVGSAEFIATIPVHYQTVMCHMRLGQVEEAKQVLESGLLVKDDYLLNGIKGEILMFEQKPMEALSYFEKSNKLNLVNDSIIDSIKFELNLSNIKSIKQMLAVDTLAAP
ncbi:MAG: Tfp pilus assembly protein PilF [Flavobacteriales bacterium]